MLQSVRKARHFPHAPGERERADDRRHQRGAQHARAENRAPDRLAQHGRQRVADPPDAAKPGAVLVAQRRGGGDQHRAGQALRERRAKAGVEPRRLEVARPQLFLGDGRLLIEDHPRVEHRADDRRRHIEKIPVSHRPVERVPRHVANPRVRARRYDEEGEFKQPDKQRRPLHAAIGARAHDGQQRRHGKRQRERARDAVKLADARHAGEFRDQRADHRRRQPRQRQPRPDRAKARADQFAIAAPGDDPQPHGEFLHHVKHRDQRQQQRQEAIAPARPGLRAGDDIAGVRVGEHDEQPRPPHGDPAERRGRLA